MNNFHKSMFYSVAFVSLFFIAYELYIRSKGFVVAYDDDNGELYADLKRKIYLPKDEATVFLGTSKMKFDLCTDTWRELTNEIPIMLANVGSSPTMTLKDLSEDENFKGKILLDVNEGLFFNTLPWIHERPNKNINYAKKETPAQRLSFHINSILESQFVFLDKGGFSLSALLSRLSIPPRQGLRDFPPYPIGFGRVNRDRQSFVDVPMERDTHQVNTMINVWMSLAKMGAAGPRIKQTEIDSIIQITAGCVNKIRNRGGEVVIVRPPTSGSLWEGEKMAFPRSEFFDRLVNETKCLGIHFEDYPKLNAFHCIELSHLTKSDASYWTKNLIEILNREKDWVLNQN